MNLENRKIEVGLPGSSKKNKKHFHKYTYIFIEVHE